MPHSDASPAAPLPPAICLMGPTACGKTDLAVMLAARLPVEVVSVDSALVYRGMDIGTAKPDAATLAVCPHRLIDIRDPHQSYSAGQFREDALMAMREISAAGRIPLLVGGSMLYFKVLRSGLDALPPADPALRRDLDRRAELDGWPALHAQLAELDAAAAARIAPNDAQRIQRALEIRLSTGRASDVLLGRGSDPLPFRLIEVALLPSERAPLHRRIETRFRAMLAAGLVDELRGLRQRFPLTVDLPAMRCVGYRQAWRHLQGDYGEAELLAAGSAATRQLARRQMTWLRRWPDAAVFDCLREDVGEILTAWLAHRIG